jgi:Rod binding domain-containing protein
MATLSTPGLAAPPNGVAANAALAGIAKSAAKTKLAERAKGAAQDFEAVFLNTLFQQMFSSVGKGPFGGGAAAGVWRSLLTDEYAKSFAKAGGIGIADHVQRALLAQQEIR